MPTRAAPRLSGVKFIGYAALLIVAVNLIAGLFLEAKLRRQLHQRIAEDLHESALVVEYGFSAAGDAFDRRFADDTADRMASILDARVSVIRADGEVLGDSSIELHELSLAEDHSTRPEIVAALTVGEGSSTRQSNTVHADLLYLAKQIAQRHEGLPVVVRVARPLRLIEEEVAALRLLLAYAALMCLIAASVGGGLLSIVATQNFRGVLSSARSRAFNPDGAAKHTGAKPASSIEPLNASFVRLSEELMTTMEELADERDRFRVVLKSMQEAVIALNARFEVTLLNPAARRFLSISDDAEGSPLRDVTSVSEVVALAESSGPARETEFSITLHTDHVPGPAANKETHILLARATPQSDGGRLIVMHDVTEIRRLERVRQDFVANVSHELRTPVSIIRANAETLLSIDARPDAPERKFTEALMRHADRLGRLITDLLDISRIEVGKYLIESQPTKIAALVRRAIEGVDSKATVKGMSVEIDIPETLSAYADPKALEQVVTNLTENAVKYALEGGSLTISAREDGGQVLMEFADDGPGIDPIHRPRIFERFYRVDPGRSREMGGTGLGLAIVKHLMEAMQGNVGVVANKPRGSRFWLTIPREPTADGAASPRVDAAGEAR